MTSCDSMCLACGGGGITLNLMLSLMYVSNPPPLLVVLSVRIGVNCGKFGVLFRALSFVSCIVMMSACCCWISCCSSTDLFCTPFMLIWTKVRMLVDVGLIGLFVFGLGGGLCLGG